MKFRCMCLRCLKHRDSVPLVAVATDGDGNRPSSLHFTRFIASAAQNGNEMFGIDAGSQTVERGNVKIDFSIPDEC